MKPLWTYKHLIHLIDVEQLTLCYRFRPVVVPVPPPVGPTLWLAYSLARRVPVQVSVFLNSLVLAYILQDRTSQGTEGRRRGAF